MKNLLTILSLVLSISLSAQTQTARWKIEKKYNETIFSTLTFSTASRGFAAGWEYDKDLGGFLTPVIKYTSDKGDSWKSANIDNLDIIPMTSSKANGDTVVIAGIENEGDGFFSVSYDAGKNWKSTAMPEDIYAIYFLNGKEGFACGKKGFISYTKDAGLNWQTVAFPSKDDILSLSFSKVSGRLTGFICGESGLFAASSDTGKTWTLKNLSTNYDLSDVEILSNGKGWMTAIDGVILHTADTGNTWTAQFQNSFSQFNSVAALNDSTTIAGGVMGELMILQKNQWVSHLSLNNETDEIFSEIKCVTIIDTANMWFCSADGELVRTRREDNSTSNILANDATGISVYFQAEQDNLIVENRDGKPGHLYLLSSMGSLIEERKLESGANNIDCRGIASGIYKIKLTSDDKMTHKVYTFAINK